MPPSDKKDPIGPKGTPIDIGKILLPKKEGPAPETTGRINAGALLEQEQRAGAEGTAAQGAKPEQMGGGAAQATGRAPDDFHQKIVYPEPAVPAQAAAPEAPTPPQSTLRSLETFGQDIEKLVVDKKISTVQVAAAEAQRRAHSQEPQAAAAAAEPWWHSKVVLFVAGGILVAGALLIAAAALLCPAPTTQVTTLQASAQAPFIAVDHVTQIDAGAEPNHASLMDALDTTRRAEQLSLGLLDEILVTQPATSTGGAPTVMDAQTLLNLLAPSIPQELVRTIDPHYYLLGVHSFDQNQAFLIVRTDNYETAYAAMLAWEHTIQVDLSPLFTRTPSPHLGSTASTTQAATSSAQILPTGFSDRVVENHDARVIQNSSGDILLLWTFLDRNTLTITTNEYTLREIIARAQAPVIPQP
ncbi:MAG: hypothetical protein KGI70_02205 [Patescibacteria group bacterium]|nr:hypothetical protein [Patescibacteria group bacterium]